MLVLVLVLVRKERVVVEAVGVLQELPCIYVYAIPAWICMSWYNWDSDAWVNYITGDFFMWIHPDGTLSSRFFMR